VALLAVSLVIVARWLVAAGLVGMRLGRRSWQESGRAGMAGAGCRLGCCLAAERGSRPGPGLAGAGLVAWMAGQNSIKLYGQDAFAFPETDRLHSLRSNRANDSC
jgi:hypothetical protein